VARPTGLATACRVPLSAPIARRYLGRSRRTADQAASWKTRASVCRWP